MAPTPTQPFAEERQKNNCDELLKLFKALLPFLLRETVLLVRVVGGD